MRVGRFTADGEDRIGRFEQNEVIDVTPAAESFAEALAQTEAVAECDGESYDLNEISYLPPTTSRNSVFCAALNYQKHAEESGRSVPERPYLFLKLARSLVGQHEPISYHNTVTSEIDYEGELACVIGSPCRHVSTEEALEYVAGYTILNDVSARDLQLSFSYENDDMIDWFAGKAMQSTTPIGPYVVCDEIDDPQNLSIASRVNGETLQDENTEMMIYSVAELVSYISSLVELQPGDVIATGTPEGVGVFQDISLEPGDEVEVEVEGIGTLQNTVSEAE
ncbi:fumarylacetoacetate hydrolase family protein [Halobellus sp. EA9]|uniref:fumarylacetoacetate hydrolase family protein n=1 Tax=Halobellus sp. EA9 TaxID=3421647 RepID=UPI003EB81386